FGQRFRSDLGVARILTQPTSAIWLQTCTPWTATGKLLWKTNLDKHRGARITGSRRLYEGRLYVPVASLEEASAGVPDYECCTFRGSVVALDAANGRQIWKTYMITEHPRRVGKNKQGVDQWGTSGAGVWSAA